MSKQWELLETCTMSLARNSFPIVVRTEWVPLGHDSTVLLHASSGVSLRPVDATLAVVACWFQVTRERLTECHSEAEGNGVPRHMVLS